MISSRAEMRGRALPIRGDIQESPAGTDEELRAGRIGLCPG